MTTPRRQAREAALQILYLWEVGRTDPHLAVETFFSVHQPGASEAVIAFADAIVRGTTAEVEALDHQITQHSAHWRIERLAVVDRLILRMAIWELMHEAETPGPVVINEAVELARRFSSEDAVRFVNGVLDAVRKSLAPAG